MYRENYNIVFDIDDTIADLHTPFCNNIKPFLTCPIDSSEIYNPKWMIDNLKKDLQIYTVSDWYIFMRDYIITPEDFFNFKPIKGSLEFINKVSEKGYTISFCSRIISYKDYPEVKYQWLKKYFSNIEFDLMIISKSTTKRLLNCKYIIDDSIEVAREVNNALVPIKPWNEKFLKDNKTVLSFSDFKELEAIL